MKYYHVHWPRKERFFLPGPKILAVRKCARPTFSYTEDEAYVMMAFNVIRTERVSMKYLAAPVSYTHLAALHGIPGRL